MRIYFGGGGRGAGGTALSPLPLETGLPYIILYGGCPLGFIFPPVS